MADLSVTKNYKTRIVTVGMILSPTSSHIIHNFLLAHYSTQFTTSVSLLGLSFFSFFNISFIPLCLSPCFQYFRVFSLSSSYSDSVRFFIFKNQECVLYNAEGLHMKKHHEISILSYDFTKCL